MPESRVLVDTVRLYEDNGLWAATWAQGGTWDHAAPSNALHAVADALDDQAHNVSQCTTADCENGATRLVTCDGAPGFYPYCDGCAEVLLRGGEREHPQTVQLSKEDA